MFVIPLSPWGKVQEKEFALNSLSRTGTNGAAATNTQIGVLFFQ